jgi:prohibitin 2
MSQQFRDAFQRMAKQAQAAAASGGGGGGAGGGGGGGNGARRAAEAAYRATVAGVAAAALGYGAYQSIYTVQGGHRAVVFNRLTGMKDVTYGEGLNFNIPWFEKPTIFDVRTRPVNLQTLTGSKDLQMVTIAIRVLHKPNPNRLVDIYRQLGTNYDERVLPSIMNECAKAVVARYNANELLTKRDQVSKEISADLQRRATAFNILLDDVAITHLAFSPEYARAVEAKQVAQQDAERAKYIVLGAQQEKKTIITKARGEAESASLIGTAVKKNPGFMKLRRIDAARDIADIVAGSGNKAYLNADSLLLNLLGDSDDKFEKGLEGGAPKRGIFR